MIYALMALAAYRLTQLIVADSITASLRFRLMQPLPCCTIP